MTQPAAIEGSPKRARRRRAPEAVPHGHRTWPIVLLLGLASAPLVLMYLYLVVDTVSATPAGSLIPDRFTLANWSFLWQDRSGMADIWLVTWNTLIFAGATTLIVLLTASMAGYALSRLNTPFRGFLLGGVMVLHAFPSVTLLVGTFLVLQMTGLYDTLIGVILAKVALELPFGIWIMKGFYDAVPWEIEMAGIADGAGRLTVLRRLVMPQVGPGLLAVGLFSFLDAWREYILPQVLAPSNNVQVLAVYLANLMRFDTRFDIGLFKAVGVFYMVPVFILFMIFQRRLMNIYGGGTKG